MKKFIISKNLIKPVVVFYDVRFRKAKLVKKLLFFIDFLKIVKSQMSKTTL